jgi:putative acetyltransferase
VRPDASPAAANKKSSASVSLVAGTHKYAGGPHIAARFCYARARMRIQIDDLRGPEVAALLAEHLQCMAATSPPESRHALDLERLRAPGVTFWTVWNGTELAGCGALKELDPTHGEIKSMRTAEKYLRKGAATIVLREIIAEAQRRAYRRLSLETGAMPYFAPAHALYTKFGFTRCAPFGDYVEDPNSLFFSMTVPE